MGWNFYKLDTATGQPVALSGLGVRIFDDGSDADGKTSNAAKRRQPRAQRRQIDRRLARRKQLLKDLENADLMPPKGRARDLLFNGNPYLV